VSFCFQELLDLEDRKVTFGHTWLRSLLQFILRIGL